MSLLNPRLLAVFILPWPVMYASGFAHAMNWLNPSTILAVGLLSTLLWCALFLSYLRKHFVEPMEHTVTALTKHRLPDDVLPALRNAIISYHHQRTRQLRARIVTLETGTTAGDEDPVRAALARRIEQQRVVILNHCNILHQEPANQEAIDALSKACNTIAFLSAESSGVIAKETQAEFEFWRLLDDTLERALANSLVLEIGEAVPRLFRCHAAITSLLFQFVSRAAPEVTLKIDFEGNALVFRVDSIEIPRRLSDRFSPIGFEVNNNEVRVPVLPSDHASKQFDVKAALICEDAGQRQMLTVRLNEAGVQLTPDFQNPNLQALIVCDEDSESYRSIRHYVAADTPLVRINPDDLSQQDNCHDVTLPVTQDKLNAVFDKIRHSESGTQPVVSTTLEPLRSLPETPIFDLQSGLVKANQRPELAEEMLNLLLQNLEADQGRINSAWQARDRQTTSKAVHRLNGAVTYTGANRLGACLEQLHHVIRTGTEAEIDQQLKLFNAEVVSLIAWNRENPAPYRLRPED